MSLKKENTVGGEVNFPVYRSYEWICSAGQRHAVDLCMSVLLKQSGTGSCVFSWRYSEEKKRSLKTLLLSVLC